MTLRASAALAAVLFHSTVSMSAAQAPVYPDVTGTWTGSYMAAFPEDHSRHPQQAVEIEMELHVSHQENNVFWLENRWRVIGDADWHVEVATGTLAPWDLNELVIVESAPNPEHGSTGVFRGELDGGRMLLVYEGIGSGISFAVALDKP